MMAAPPEYVQKDEITWDTALLFLCTESRHPADLV